MNFKKNSILVPAGMFKRVDTPHKSISTNAQYVTQHWIFWKKFITQIQCIHWKTTETLKCLQISEPRNGLITPSNHIYWLFPFSDWLDSLISPRGLLLAAFQVPTIWSPGFNFMSGVGKKVITRTWMWEIFLQGPILHADAVILVSTFLVATNLVSCIPPTCSNHLELLSTLIWYS